MWTEKTTYPTLSLFPPRTCEDRGRRRGIKIVSRPILSVDSHSERSMNRCDNIDCRVVSIVSCRVDCYGNIEVVVSCEKETNHSTTPAVSYFYLCTGTSVLWIIDQPRSGVYWRAVMSKGTHFTFMTCGSASSVLPLTSFYLSGPKCKTKMTNKGRESGARWKGQRDFTPFIIHWIFLSS